MSVMGLGLCTPGGGRRSISSSTAWRVGRSAATVLAKGRPASGWAAAGLMAIAVMLRQVSASFACGHQPDEQLPPRAARRRWRHRARALPARRAPSPAGPRLRAPRRVRRGWISKPSGASSPATSAPLTWSSGPFAGSSRWRTRSDRDAASPDAEVTVPKPRPSAVAAVVSPTAKIGLLRCSLASASARAPLALVIRIGLAVRQRRGEVVGRMQHLQPEQRRDNRRMAARAERLGQRRRLAFRPGDQHAHTFS